MENHLLTILTVRMGSERFPGKCMEQVNGVPLVSWIVRRLKKLGDLCIATTSNEEDYVFDAIGQVENVRVWHHPEPNDVLTRMETVRKEWYPNANFILRALGDCPFISPEIIIESTKTMCKYNSEAFRWMLPPEVLPVYGSREFPYHINAWNRIIKNATGSEREHIDQYFDRHRDNFRIVYHEPPVSHYFRPYRLEVDWPEDLELVRRVANGPGMLAHTIDIIKFLDRQSGIVKLNQNRMEKTGPLVSFSYTQRRGWYSLMSGQPIVDWGGELWNPPDKKALPQFCNANRCLIGYGHAGKLYTKEGHVLCGLARVKCACGAGRVWRAPIC